MERDAWLLVVCSRHGQVNVEVLLGADGSEAGSCSWAKYGCRRASSTVMRLRGSNCSIRSIKSMLLGDASGYSDLKFALCIAAAGLNSCVSLGRRNRMRLKSITLYMTLQ